jgi:hypothetical protein
MLVGVFLAFFVFQSPYLRFVGKDNMYYSQFAEACDQVLQQHPVGTNDWVYHEGTRSPQNALRISPHDPSLPKAIRNVSPDDIIVSSNRVWIGVGVGRGAFGIVWEQDEGLNTWSLRTYAESMMKVHYTTTRLLPGINKMLQPAANVVDDRKALRSRNIVVAETCVTLATVAECKHAKSNPEKTCTGQGQIFPV